MAGKNAKNSKVQKTQKPENIKILPGTRVGGEKGIYEIRLLGEMNDGKLLIYTNVKNGLWSLGRTLPPKYKA